MRPPAIGRPTIYLWDNLGPRFQQILGGGSKTVAEIFRQFGSTAGIYRVTMYQIIDRFIREGHLRKDGRLVSLTSAAAPTEDLK